MSESACQKVCLVIGGEGFVGKDLVNQLMERQWKVKIFDIVKTTDHKEAEYFVGDLCSEADLAKACEGCSVVFHTATPPIGGSVELSEKVNVHGTENVIRVCKKMNVQKLVFTSTASVIFDGSNIVNADETVPYVQSAFDPYMVTKAKAEKMILAANGQDGLLTVAIRPSGVYGPGDKLMIPSYIAYAKKKVKVIIGDNSNIADYTYVGNISHSLILAAEKLEEGSPVAGQAFNITDGNPIPFWTFPFYVASLMGEPTDKRIMLPKGFGWSVGLFCEAVTLALKPFVKVNMVLDRFRVNFTCIHRFYDITKARTLLGYEPIFSFEEGVKLSLQSHGIKID
ncbi:sterol-4-alpha-carboxylate 3-dehydrogenase, decarboxylating [Basidiobolus meristosporus CBS 931.73]|uniref:Sterol-4-alpha-carboxylate 3-dehydrogenase, decarboxylating n=1 Tax=Basidiobolus meristosporus CBS 931.73 TaxID=1314790 RepID=A0A1Y1YH40_9FUNG|nr:sterol-4-alpha-carboxylate 3-dehydrogenase, decarboxylating [Basidiobolus meristosporus CBS 931.73]|eukprot:ORX97332.1 sterol-4-alpha-carboxylate 3-dehydrogenase, decarboxylating [Basidiobolus meristosporus CBS 931.73]